MNKKYFTKETSIRDLELSARVRNSLQKQGIFILGDLEERIHTKLDLYKIRNLGKSRVEEIIDKLLKLNLIKLSESGEIEFMVEKRNSEVEEENLLLQNKINNQNSECIEQMRVSINEVKEEIEKKKEFLLQLQQLLQEKEKLMEINKQLDDEINALMSKMYGDYDVKRK